MNQRPIIVIKKKGVHGGHHGGAWKVAYADFVTAMMSLFIVLWLLNSTPQVKKAIAGYFNDPRGTNRQMGTEVLGEGKSITLDKTNVEKLRESIKDAILKQKDLDKLKNQVELTMTPEGLRIELIEGKNGTFFQSGGSKLSPSGEELIGLLADQLKSLPNKLFIEGHTDSKPYPSSNGYTNWELSSDRANSARRLLQQDGVVPNQVLQVRGFADSELRVPADPLDPSNRRVTLIVQWVAAPPGTVGPETLDTDHKDPAADKTPDSAKPSASVTAEPAKSSPDPKAAPATAQPVAAQPAAAQPAAAQPAAAQPAAPANPEAQPPKGRTDLPSKPSATTPSNSSEATPALGKIDLPAPPSVSGPANARPKQTDATKKPQK